MAEPQPPADAPADPPASAPARPLLLLVDGHAVVYRAFFALQHSRPLTSPRGELTTGVYGFASILLKALAEYRPFALAAAFDTSAPTFRSTTFEAYKATRKAPPEGLPGQVRLTRQLLETMQVPVFRLEGFEADDVIGTLSRQAVDEQGMDVIILTGDNDLLQLVNPHVRVFMPARGIADPLLYGELQVAEKYGGLRPQQIPDLKALRGDTSDNIPGVPGIGDKTAQKLILEHGSVEALLERLPALPEKQRALLEPYAEQVRMARGLATIQCDAPVELDVERARLGDPRRPEVISLFYDLGFKSLVDRLPRADAAPRAAGLGSNGAQLGLFGGPDGEPSTDGASAAAQPSARIVTSLAELDALLAEIRAHGGFAFNVQATGTLPTVADVVGIGLAAGEEVSAYLPLGHAEGQSLPVDQAFERLRPLFADPRLPRRAHNAKFHLLLLARHGVPLDGLACDTMIAAYLLESGQRALALRDLAWTKLQVELPSVASLLGTGKKAISMAQLPVADAAAYATLEASLVERLAPLLEQELDEAGQTALFRDIELPLVPVLAGMERAGIKVDVPYLEDLGRELHGRLADLERQIVEQAGHPFNIGSTQQLSAVLFEELKLQTRTRRSRTKSGHQSTGVEVLEELREVHPIVGLILEHRQLQKLKSTYVDALLLLVNPATGRVHTSFNQTVAATGRLSSSDPNLQNIPIRTDVGRRVRRAFVAQAGMRLLSADYSQIELRILAHMADDPTLLEAFAEGDDPHAATAAEVLGVDIEKVTGNDRRVAKMVNYGVLYGMSEYGLAERTGLPAAEAGRFIQRYFERFGTVRAFQDKVLREARARGYAETLLGRRRYIPEIHSPIFSARQAAERATLNAPIQGTASDIAKIAMIRVAAFLAQQAPRVSMLLQVHDELLFEGPEPELRRIAPRLCALMEGAYELRARLHVDLKLGENWEDMHPFTPAESSGQHAAPAVANAAARA